MTENTTEWISDITFNDLEKEHTEQVEIINIPQKKTTHQALVSQVENIYPHPNADALDIVRVDNYECAVKRGEFKLGDLFVFIVPDTLVNPARPEFAFLSDNILKKVRIKVKRLRGYYSQGLILPAPPGFGLGDDTWDYFELERYDPEAASENIGDARGGPNVSKYDVDSINKFTYLFDGLEVVATEKIHGSNYRVGFLDGEIYVGSRSMWKKDGNNPWWNCYRKYPQIEEFIKNNPGLLLYGELYGCTQDIRYGLTENAFAAFDVRIHNGGYLPYDEFCTICDRYNIPRVPELFRGTFDFPALQELAEQPSALYDGGKEGIVIKGVIEEYKGRLGRTQAKYISNWYFTRKGK